MFKRVGSVALGLALLLAGFAATAQASQFGKLAFWEHRSPSHHHHWVDR